MNRPSAMWPHSTVLTCSQSSAGRAASVAKARTAACRFDINSAAGMPLPTTSAIDSATRLRPEADGVEAIAADAGGRLPRCRQLEAVHLRQRRRQQRPLDAARLVQLPRLPQHTRAPFAPGRDLVVQQRDERRVVPRLLNEVPDAAAHGFDGEVDRAPAGHHDDRQRRVERLQA